MRTAGCQEAGFFLVEIFRQASAHIADRTADIGSSDQDWKVAHVSFVLLFEVIVKTVFMHSAGRERRPRPVLFALHHAQELLAKSFSIHGRPPILRLPLPSKTTSNVNAIS